MKKFLFLSIFFCAFFTQLGWGQTTIFSENMGTPSSNTLINSYTGWQNQGVLTFSSTDGVTDVRTTTASSGYPGASGSGNVFMGTATTNNRNFQISNINTTGYIALTLTFGMLRGDLNNGLTVEVSSDGTNYTALTFSQPPTANVWTLITASGTIPATSNLRIRFSKNNNTSFRIDDVKLTGSLPAPPTKLAITSVNGGISPSVNTSFTIVVQAQDNTNSPQNVTSNTDIALSLATGNGNLSGNLSGTIAAGTSSITISGILYDVVETGVSITATRTSGDLLTPGTSTTFEVLSAATKLILTSVPTSGQINTSLPSITVEARRDDNSKDLNYNGNVTLAKYSGPGNISGTLSLAAISGTAVFSNIQFDQAGLYKIIVSASGLANDTSGVIGILGLTEVILPQYIQGLNGTNNNRIPFAYRVQISGLQPSATYRFFNQIVTSADAPTTNGAGNQIYVTSSGDFVRGTSTNLGTAGQYGEFTTDINGDYSGWFITEPTGNARFTPGNVLYMRIMLNDGAGGTNVESRVTTTNGVTVVNFGTTGTDGTGIRGNSFATAKDFVFLYDNTAGVGRPITGTFIESDGTSGGTTYIGFYQTSVDTTSGAWGAIIPNQLSNGIRRIERRSFANGSVVFSNTDADGLWPSGANTVNPSTGSTPVVITSDEAPLAASRTFNLTAMIEGFYNGSLMVSDTVTVEMRNTLSPFNLIESRKLVLNTLGQGTGNFYNVAEGTNYYIAVKHRNSIETWSANTPQFVSGTMSYNFTSAQGQTYGNNSVQKGSIWCIYSGDVNQDGVIDITDVGNVDIDNLNFVTGYTVTDVNGDNLVDLSDLAIADINNLNFISKIVP